MANPSNHNRFSIRITSFGRYFHRLVLKYNVSVVALLGVVGALLNLGTLLAVSGQLEEMRSGAPDAHNLAVAAKEQAQTTRDVLVASQRAWVVPFQAKLSSPVELGKDLSYEVTVSDVGREPALNFVASIQYYIFSHAQQLSGEAAKAINTAIRHCSSYSVIGDNAIYPSTNFNVGLTYRQKIPGSDITSDVVSGDSIILIVGCAPYTTLDIQKHTEFCFSYINHSDSADSLGFCRGGNAAE